MCPRPDWPTTARWASPTTSEVTAGRWCWSRASGSAAGAGSPWSTGWPAASGSSPSTTAASAPPTPTRALQHPLDAQDVLAVLDHAGIQQASVLGTSLGGMVAQELALAHPERVDRLVLVATVPGGPHSRPMPLGTTYLFAVSPFLTNKARLRQFVNNALGPSILRRRLYWEEPRRFARMVAGFLTEPASSTRRSTWPVRRAS
ncbi:MAG TPA: alpha/beta hydrolase [Actinomycetes bacterium]|nr:alpha/beta hydrolase [Actinomycetes bacterium]